MRKRAGAWRTCPGPQPGRSVGLDAYGERIAVVPLGQVEGEVVLLQVVHVVGDQIAVAHIEELPVAAEIPAELALEAAGLLCLLVLLEEVHVQGGRDEGAGLLLHVLGPVRISSHILSIRLH